MKTISQIIGGSQALLDIPYDLQSGFEAYLSYEYKTFLHLLRVIEDEMPSRMREPDGKRTRIYRSYGVFLAKAIAA